MDREVKNLYFDAVILYTKHAREIGRLFELISRLDCVRTKINYFNKAVFWSEITKAGKLAIEANRDITCTDLQDVIVDCAVQLLESGI